MVKTEIGFIKHCLLQLVRHAATVVRRRREAAKISASMKTFDCYDIVRQFYPSNMASLAWAKSLVGNSVATWCLLALLDQKWKPCAKYKVTKNTGATYACQVCSCNKLCIRNKMIKENASNVNNAKHIDCWVLCAMETAHVPHKHFAKNSLIDRCCCHGRPEKFFQEWGNRNVEILLIFSGCWRCSEMDVHKMLYAL